MTEYALIVGLVAILCIGAVEKMGQSVKRGFEKSTDSLARRVTAKVDRAGKKAPAGSMTGGSLGGADEVGGVSGGDDAGQPGTKPVGAKPQH